MSNKKNIFLFLLALLATELISATSFLFPNWQIIIFLITGLLFILLSFIDDRFPVWLLLTELFIGSKGHLWHANINGTTVSVRMFLWLYLMLFWLTKKITSFRNKQLLNIKKGPLEQLFGSANDYLFAVLFLAIVWGLINAKINKNENGNIFSDFNAWLYFAVFFPLKDYFKRKDSQRELILILNISCFWISIKTLAVLFIFTHFQDTSIGLVYRWIRDSGVGEITRITKYGDNFYRIFFQSHIYSIVGFFVALLAINNIAITKIKLFAQDKMFWLNFILGSLSLSVIILGLSRSNWLGFLFGLSFYLILLLMNKKWTLFFRTGLFSILLLMVSMATIFTVLNFPYPKTGHIIDTLSLLSERANEATNGEAAVSSRWSLLPKLKERIINKPIGGYGFGQTVTYKSSDPRVLKNNPNGDYTTYAFEWGWLDIWIKIGLIGAIIYLAILAKNIFSNLFYANSQITINNAMSLGMLSFIVVSFFSPYFNHPLGIGYLLIFSLFNQSDILFKTPAKNILFMGVKLKILSKRTILNSIIRESLLSKRRLFITTPNPEIILSAQKNRGLKTALQKSDLSLVDGTGLNLAISLSNQPSERITGVELLKSTLSTCNHLGKKIFVINLASGLSGSKEIKQRIGLDYPNVILFIEDLPKSDKLNKTLGEKIRSISPDAIFVNFGSPWQEEFIYNNIDNFGQFGLVAGVGGAFDFITNRIKRAPYLLRMVGLEWFWRLCQQPRKRLVRITRAVLLFPYSFFIWSFLNYEKNKEILISDK